jgi:hypothetical protein
MPYNNAIPDAIHKITKGPLLIVYDVIFRQGTQRAGWEILAPN